MSRPAGTGRTCRPASGTSTPASRRSRPDTLTLDEALQLLTLPRVVGTGADGEEIIAQNGRYGPYIKQGDESRSLEREDQLFTVTLDEALALLAAAEDARPAAATPPPPLRELGRRPGHRQAGGGQGGPLRAVRHRRRDQRRLRKGDAVEEITIERAAELLADRRARGPLKKAPAKKAAGEEGHAAKKAAAKKTRGQEDDAAKKTAAKKARRRRVRPRRSSRWRRIQSADRSQQL